VHAVLYGSELWHFNKEASKSCYIIGIKNGVLEEVGKNIKERQKPPDRVIIIPFLMTEEQNRATQLRLKNVWKQMSARVYAVRQEEPWKTKN
jgi:hypothetical protein